MAVNPLAKLVVQAIASLGLLAAGMWVLVTVDWAANQLLVSAATGWIGLVMGYWLR